MALNRIFKSLWRNVWFSNKIKLKQLRPHDYYNLYPFQANAGRMDFITGLPKSEGKSVIMVVVDRLTKYAHFCALSHPFKVNTFSTAFMETIQKLHGNLKIIVSDKDPIVTWKFLDIIIFLSWYSVSS